METFQADLKVIKRLIKLENKQEIKRLSKRFLPEYNARILDGLNLYEKDQWIKFNYN
jgi:hypothetical protein